MGEPVNLERLEDFSDGTPGGVAVLVQLFLDDSRETLSQLVAAGAAGDWAAVRLLAHRFGGTCAACGATALADRLYALETLPAGLDAEIGAAIEGIRRAHVEAAAFLTLYLEGLATP